MPAPQAARMAVTQRPATQETLVAPSGRRPLWRELPSWFVIGEEDRIIPAELQRFLAERAGAQRTLEIAGPGAQGERVIFTDLARCVRCDQRYPGKSPRRPCLRPGK